MRISWLKTLLFVAIALPPDGLAAPCEKRCSTHNFVTRKAAAAIPPIIPIPKPITPINPFPVTPKPITPKPITPRPKPIPPKPVEPVHPKPGSGAQCKRAPGEPCSDVTPFGTADLEAIRNKGRIAQADLLATQKATPPAQDVERVDVPARYEHESVSDIPSFLEKDESRFIIDNHLLERYSEGSDWTRSTTRSKEPGPGVRPEDSILVTYTNPADRGIVIAESFRKYDNLDDLNRLRWSDMVMYDMKTSFGNPGELKYMIRANIEGGDSAVNTRNYINEAIQHVKGDKENVNIFRSDPSAPGITPQELAAYQLLAGSDHVHRVLLMLKDYPATMRNVRIESLSVTTEKTRGADENYHIVIKFIRVENP